MKLYFQLFLLLFLCSCVRNTATDEGAKLDYASGLSITHEKGYDKVVVKDPWNTNGVLQTYILVPKDSDLPANLPQGVVVRTPLTNVLVYSDVHAGVIKELGCISSVKSVCDAKYFKTPDIVAGLNAKTIVDCGVSTGPTVERIVSAAPEAILLSPFQNAGFGVLDNLGVPIIQLADYMEQSPLGRAEWIKFLGLLYDRAERADSIFGEVEQRYDSLKKLVEKVAERPKVVSETMTSGVWYVPGGNSYKARLYKDAGADYPWSDNPSAGSLSLDFPQVFEKAQDADIWLITTYGDELTAKGLLDIYPHNGEFAAFKNEGIYYSNTAVSRLFEDTPFHPDLLLREYIKIFHEELLPDYRLRYYKPMSY